MGDGSPSNYSLNMQLNEQFVLPETFNNLLLNKDYYDPIRLRNVVLINSGLDYASENIYADEELFQNYLTYESTQEDFLEVANSFKSICAGVENGFITNYEIGSKMFQII